MKKVIVAFIIGTLAIAFATSCQSGKQSKKRVAALELEIDSLRYINSEQHDLIVQMNESMDEIAFVLDTIAVHERVIMLGIDEQGKRLTGNALKRRVEVLANVLQEQKEKLDSIEMKYSNSVAQITLLHSMISYLETSLAQKDIELRQVKTKLVNTTKDVQDLKKTVTDLTDTIAYARQQNDEQRQIIEEQENLNNEVYYIIGTKSQLVANGVVSKNKKVRFADMDKTRLVKEDLRTLKSLRITGKNPRILADVPADSYLLERIEIGDFILTILDSDRFWKANNKVLVIQVN